jgi:GTP-binding protein HflX
VAISAASGFGLDSLRDAVIEMVSADFAEAEIETAAANGRVLAYLGAHAEIFRQEFQDAKVILHCSIPRHLLHHIQGPDVHIRFLSSNGQAAPS